MKPYGKVLEKFFWSKIAKMQVIETIDKMALQAGFEPATCPLGGGRAIQLCHRSLFKELV